ncbi:related to endonuclease/exonuclease/phosphatase family protein [Cephalotrichum gorgonifer]|uniref:Related to endonuclease/exonuclease/phosphatase family protein n=1 Tax=Cephalotrichum gorgonifer TaxID=2041049 RepID=A0AAE8MWJ4_9PEZI|nr:related to endonuclease/exonuclease/phosphatase family protein [Cephalotrichum gorgonifer]
MMIKDLLFFFAFLSPKVTAVRELPVRLVTFNIRGGGPNPDPGEEVWEVRRPLVADTLTTAAAGVDGPTFIGLQEVHPGQLVDLKETLGNGWAHVGVGRDDGDNGGDYSPILYQSNDVDLIWNETKWLSETPDVPSFGWGATNRRTVSIGVFEHKATRQRFIAANTHLDHAVPEARVKGLRIIIDRLRAAREEYGPLTVSLTGDFNSEPGEDAHSEMEKIGYLEDLYEISNDRRGPYATFTGFSKDVREKKIDYMYIGPAGDARWRVGTYEVVENLVNGVYSSDHRAVVGDLTLQY